MIMRAWDRSPVPVSFRDEIVNGIPIKTKRWRRPVSKSAKCGIWNMNEEIVCRGRNLGDEFVSFDQPQGHAATHLFDVIREVFLHFLHADVLRHGFSIPAFDPANAPSNVSLHAYDLSRVFDADDAEVVLTRHRSQRFIVSQEGDFFVDTLTPRDGGHKVNCVERF
jgi:hypothetical protein